jgi:hypothetical protein
MIAKAITMPARTPRRRRAEGLTLSTRIDYVTG